MGREEVIKVLRENPGLTSAELGKKIGVSRVAILNSIKPLKKIGVIKPEVKLKNGLTVIKYFLKKNKGGGRNGE